jgi:hypothetical protein
MVCRPEEDQRIELGLLGSERRDHFIKQSEHRGVTPKVVDVDQCGGAIKGAHRCESKIVGAIIVLSELVGRGNQCTKRATPLHTVIRRTDRKAIFVPCELTAAPVSLVLDESSRLLNDLNLEWFRHDDCPLRRAVDLTLKGTTRGLSWFP